MIKTALSHITLGILVCLTPFTQAAKKPNLVLIISDDAGYSDFGFQPDSPKDISKLTPHIDSIAKQGALFSNAYMTASVCSPSRAGFMTGRYQQRFGYENNLPRGSKKEGLPLTETTLATKLQAGGYKTAFIGKWHLGYTPELHPNKRGFDWFYGFLQGGRGYFSVRRITDTNVILDNTTPTKESGYLTDRLGDAACKFISQHKENPFFIIVSFSAPHLPNQPKDQDMKKTAHIQDETRASYAGLLVSLDDNVGKILNQLKADGLDANTLVIFTNDNGGQTKAGAINSPLRGKKGNLLEGGIRVPWAARWLGKIQPNTIIDEPIISLDLFPTFMEIAGLKTEPASKLDGQSLYSRMIAKSTTLKPRSLFWRKDGEKGNRAVREGKWKLYHNRAGDSQLYLFDLKSDPGESKNLALQKPEILSSMLTKLNQWEAELIQPLWGVGSKDGTVPRKRRGRKRGSRKN